MLLQRIQPKLYKPLTRFFIEPEKLTATITEADVCNRLLKAMSPNALKIGEEGEEEVDFSTLSHVQVIDLVSHYFSNALLSFFEPENPEEQCMSIMPLSEEFVEDKYSIDQTNIIKNLMAEQEFIQSQQSQGGFCGCFSSCIITKDNKDRNPTHSMQLREELKNVRSRIQLPKSERVR